MPRIKKCPDCGTTLRASASECWNCTPDYDPDYNRAQSVEGAKARYAEHENGYGIDDFEQDVARILNEGEYPDSEDAGTTLPEGLPAPEGSTVVKKQPAFGGQRMSK